MLWTIRSLIAIGLHLVRYFLDRLMQQKNLDMLNLDDLWIQASRFDTPTERLADPIPVLFQSGYLTIKGYEKKGKLYHLCFPNQEVRQGFSESLVWYYSAQDMNRYDAIVYAYSKNVLINDDMEAFMPHLKISSHIRLSTIMSVTIKP